MYTFYGKRRISVKELNLARSTLTPIGVITFLLFAVIAGSAQCNIDAETSLYNKFLENFKGSAEQQKIAVQVGKEYIAKYEKCSTEGEGKVIVYIQNWLTKYEIAALESNCTAAVSNTPEQAFDLCQPYLAKDPENLRAYLLITLAGAKTRKSTDTKLRENTVRAARRALDLISNGKTVDNWVFGKEKADAVGAVNYFAGYFSLDSAPAEAQSFLKNAANSNSVFSKEPAVYDALARAIYNNEYKPAATEYNSKCRSNPVSECDALLAKAGQMVDKVIDAYARAVALSKDPTSIVSTRNNLTTLYKLRHDNSETGLDKLIAEVLSKPLP